MKRDPHRRARRFQLGKQIQANNRRIAELEARHVEMERELGITLLALNAVEATYAYLLRTEECEVVHPNGPHCTCCHRPGVPTIVVPDPGSLDPEQPWDVCEDCVGHVRARCGVKGTEHDDEDGFLCRWIPEEAIVKPR